MFILFIIIFFLVIELEDYSTVLGNNNTKSKNITINKTPAKKQSINSNHVSENGLSSPSLKGPTKPKANTLDYEQQLNLLNSYKTIKKGSHTGSSSTLPQTSHQAVEQSFTRNNFDDTTMSKNNAKKSPATTPQSEKNSSFKNSHSSRRTSQPPMEVKEKSKSETRGKSTSLIKRLSFKFKSNSIDKSDTPSQPTPPPQPRQPQTPPSSLQYNNTSIHNQTQSPQHNKQRNGDLPPQSPVVRSSSRALRSLHVRSTPTDTEQTRPESPTANKHFFNNSQSEEDANVFSPYENKSFNQKSFDTETHLNIDSRNFFSSLFYNFLFGSN